MEQYDSMSSHLLLLTIFPNPFDIAPYSAVRVKKLMMEYTRVLDHGQTNGQKVTSKYQQLQAASPTQIAFTL